MWVAASAAQPPARSTSSPEDTLKTFLQRYLGPKGPNADKTTRYLPAFVRLSGGTRREVVVYITGQSWCGSGGCTTLVLAPERSSYEVVTKITITRLPIRLLSTESNGWHDIAVRVEGGGIQPGYEADLSFDGKRYPPNPSSPPARISTGKEEGHVIIPVTSEGIPLYE